MKAGRLARLLQTFDADAEVFLASDAEGNSYARIDGLERPDVSFSLDGVEAPLILWPKHEHLDLEFPVELLEDR